ncbi:MAG: Rieske 2Fe-2S domain-containing protein [Candidatus Omnitrophica bacterium]|nr:Rieske 2Fe-2S domain-containing protein [Candidatus Omnitrophota bacterium]
MSQFEKVASVTDVKEGEGKVVQACGREIALFNVNGQFFAIDNVCAHQGGPLGEGMLDGEEVTCPWHGWTFNVKNGSCTFNPNASVDAFKVKVEGSDILVSAS